MSILQRILKSIGYTRSPQLTFEMDQALVESLQEIADQEERSTEAVASDLLTFALAQRRAAGENLACWRSLTPREQQIAALACINYTNRQIAAHLFISPETVKTHMRNVLRKFDLHSKAELRQTLGDWDFSSWTELVE